MSVKLSAYNLLFRTFVRRGFSTVHEPGKIQRFFGKLDRFSARWPRKLAAIREIRIGERDAHWITPHSGHGKTVILYLHGGAFIARTPRTHGAFLAKLCQKTGARSLMPDYGLLPQHPFPAAQDDCDAAYRYLLDEGVEAENIILAGDSAGGFLCMSTLQRIKAAGLPMPKAVVLLSPGGVIRAEERASAWTNDGRDVMFRSVTLDNLFRMIMPPFAEGPDYHPLEFDLSGLPPMHVEVGDTEVLLDDSRILVEKVKAAGNDCDLVITPDVPHVLPVFPVPEARAAINRIATFIWKHVS